MSDLLLLPLHCFEYVHAMPLVGSCSMGTDMTNYFYWRPGKSWSVLEGEHIAFLEYSHDLGAGS